MQKTFAEKCRGPAATRCGHCGDHLKGLQVWMGSLILGSYATCVGCWVGVHQPDWLDHQRPDSLEIHPNTKILS